jgi:hypothetical protein
MKPNRVPRYAKRGECEKVERIKGQMGGGVCSWVVDRFSLAMMHL